MWELSRKLHHESLHNLQFELRIRILMEPEQQYIQIKVKNEKGNCHEDKFNKLTK